MRFLGRWFSRFLILVTGMVPVQGAHAQDWFEAFKDRATPAQLHQFLYVMPKGGDLHLHITGSVLSEWIYEIALDQSANGYRYYSKHKIENCPSGLIGGRSTPYLMLYQTVDQVGYDALDPCEQQEYVALDEFTPLQIERWQNGLRLDKPYEGRDEFFSKHWERLGDLGRNPYLIGEFLVRNMQAFTAEGLVYMEPQVPIFGFRQADGQTLTPDEVMRLSAAVSGHPSGVAKNLQRRAAVDPCRRGG